MVGAGRGHQREEGQPEILEMIRELQCSTETERREVVSRVADWQLGQAERRARAMAEDGQRQAKAQSQGWTRARELVKDD